VLGVGAAAKVAALCYTKRDSRIDNDEQFADVASRPGNYPECRAWAWQPCSRPIHSMHAPEHHPELADAATAACPTEVALRQTTALVLVITRLRQRLPKAPTVDAPRLYMLALAALPAMATKHRHRCV